MKKLVSILLVLSVLLVCIVGNAIAEEFTIHSGVTFGMTPEEVIDAESSSGFVATKDSLNSLKLGYNCTETHSDECISVNGQIAGHKGANITYHFDKETGVLVGALYLMGINKDTSLYETLREALTKKYGDPDTSLSELWHTYLKLDSYSFADMYKEMGANVSYSYNDSWLLKQDDGNYVIISGVYGIVSAGKTRVTITVIDYQYFTEEVITNVLTSFADTMDNYNNQLENDL